LVVEVLHLDSMLMVQEQLVVDELLLLLWLLLLLLLQNFPDALTSGACKNMHERLRVCGSKLRNQRNTEASVRPGDQHWTCLTAQTAASPNAIQLPDHYYQKQ
jgi:hypothetical protein